MPPPDRSRTHDRLWLLVVIGLSSAWCITAAARLGATFDEPVYLRTGLDGWRTGSHRGLLRMGTMPLPADIQTLPLYLIERASGQPWNLESDFAAALTIARLMTLPFWWLLLVSVWRAGRMIAGPWGGNLAATALACEPNSLAHASLATTDIAVTACLLAFLVSYRIGRESPSMWQRIIAPGIWYGVALTAKASALAFAPLCMAALEFERYLNGNWSLRADGRRFLRESIQIGCIGLAWTFVFCGSDWNSEPSFVAWANGLADGPLRQFMGWLADFLCIFSNAGEGIARQIKHNLRGHGAYILGQSSDHAFWYYFPALFTIKLAAPLLIAPVLLLVSSRRSLNNWAVWAALALAIFSLNCRVQIGIRLVLPCIAVAVTGLSCAMVMAIRDARTIRAAALMRCGAVAGIAWMAINSAAAWPDGLRFVNEFWGGANGGYRLVSDSNYDWGQGLPELADWQRQHTLGPLDVWYFGTDPALRQLPIAEKPFHSLPISTPADLRDQVAGRHLAVGATVLYGHGLTASHRRTAEFLRSCRPVARTRTFLIFDFTALAPDLVKQR